MPSNTLEYLIIVQHLHNGKLYSINLNAQHVNGMIPFDLAVHMYGY